MTAVDDDQFEHIVGDVLGIAPMAMSDDLTAEDIETWDSFAQINLMVALEETFGLQFDGETFMTLQSIGELRAALERASER
jgi:acyl carrier protein